MKKLVILIAVMVVIALLLPPIFGTLAKSNLDETLQRTNQQLVPYLQVDLALYEQGWFTSHGTLNMHITDAYAETLRNQMTTLSGQAETASTDLPQPTVETLVELTQGLSVDIDVFHGPLIVSDTTQFGIAQVVNIVTAGDDRDLQTFLVQADIPYFVHSSLTINFAGAADMNATAPKFSFQQEGTTIEFGGFTAVGALELEDMHTVLDAQMKGVTITTDAYDVAIEHTRITADSTYPESIGYAIGKGDMRIDRIAGHLPNGEIVDAKEVIVTYTSALNEDDTLDIDATYAATELTLISNVVTGLVTTVRMHQIDPEAINTLQSLFVKMGGASVSPETKAQLVQPIYQVMEGGISMALDPLEFTTNEQLFSARINVSTVPKNLPPPDAFSFDDPSIFLNLFQADLGLTVHKELATQAMIPQLKAQLAAGVPADTDIDDAQLQTMAEAQVPMMMSTLVNQGYLTEVDENYVVSATYDNGVVLLNGNPIPVGGLLGAQ